MMCGAIFVSFVSAAQRWVSSLTGAAGRDLTSGAPPSVQTSKLPSFQSPFWGREIGGWGARKERVRLLDVEISMVYRGLKIS